jgi:hypothetical protein
LPIVPCNRRMAAWSRSDRPVPAVPGCLQTGAFWRVRSCLTSLAACSVICDPPDLTCVLSL